MSGVRSEDEDRPWRIADSGVVLAIRLTPKSSRDMVDGIRRLSDGGLVFAARVRAAPDKGKANAALIKLVASWLGASASSVEIITGQTSRLKLVSVKGDAGDLDQLLRRRMKAFGD